MRDSFVVKLRNGPHYGAGVILSSSVILTARHVVDPNGYSLNGLPVDPYCVRIQNGFSVGEWRADELLFPAQPEIDLALVRLFEPKRIQPEFRCPVRPDPSETVALGDEVVCYGFAQEDGDVQRMPRRIVEVHGRAGSYICGESIPQGFSGGPVLVQDALIGITYARHHDQLQSYFYGGKALIDILSLIPNDSIDWETGKVHWLRRFPLGPGIDPVLTSAGLARFIRNCMRLYGGGKAIEAVALANADRMECGPNSGNKGLIDIAELPDPSFSPFNFWLTAILQAGLKSPRMLAAMLGSVDSELLDKSARDEKERMLIYLVAPK